MYIKQNIEMLAVFFQKFDSLPVVCYKLL